MLLRELWTLKLRNEPLDFFVLCSLVSAIVGELSQVDYCTANASLNAFAYADVLKANTKCISINWSTWREVGMAVETERPDDISYFDRNNGETLRCRY